MSLSSSNLLQEIKWFTFNGLVKLKRLNLKANRIHWIEFKSFKTNIKLEYLNLDDNQIIELGSMMFFGLNSLENLYLLRNAIVGISRDTFSNSSIRKLYLSNSMLSFENVCRLKSSIILQNTGRSIANISYYKSAYIENRDNVDCVKTLVFMKYKIFYNFLNDFDKTNFLRECANVMNVKQIIDLNKCE